MYRLLDELIILRDFYPFVNNNKYTFKKDILARFTAKQLEILPYKFTHRMGKDLNINLCLEPKIVLMII